MCNHTIYKWFSMLIALGTVDCPKSIYMFVHVLTFHKPQAHNVDTFSDNMDYRITIVRIFPNDIHIELHYTLQ